MMALITTTPMMTEVSIQWPIAAVVAPEAKYKAKNFNDTVVYRGADAVSAWVKAGIDAVASTPMAAMLIGAGIAVAWGVTGGSLARSHSRRMEPTSDSRPL